MEIRTHKRTGQKLLFKQKNGKVYTFYVLDEKGNKIPDGINVDGSIYYKISICLDKNII